MQSIAQNHWGWTTGQKLAFFIPNKFSTTNSLGVRIKYTVIIAHIYFDTVRVECIQ